jgi:hypothetical protein
VAEDATIISVVDASELEVGDIIKFNSNGETDYMITAISSNELTISTGITADDVLVGGETVYIKDAAFNAFVDAVEAGGALRTEAELKVERLHIANSSDYEVTEMSIPVDSTTKVKFIAKSSGEEMNDIEIAIAQEADFASGTTEVFDGLILNNFFENKPLAADNEIAVLVRKDSEVTGAYIVSLTEGAKDYRNKSYFIEDIFYQYDDLLYAKINSAATGIESALGANVLKTVHGSDGSVNAGDIEIAYGSVSDNTIFGKSANSIKISHAA